MGNLCGRETEADPTDIVRLAEAEQPCSPALPRPLTPGCVHLFQLCFEHLCGFLPRTLRRVIWLRLFPEHLREARLLEGSRESGGGGMRSGSVLRPGDFAKPSPERQGGSRPPSRVSSCRKPCLFLMLCNISEGFGRGTPLS